MLHEYLNSHREAAELLLEKFENPKVAIVSLTYALTASMSNPVSYLSQTPAEHPLTHGAALLLALSRSEQKGRIPEAVHNLSLYTGLKGWIPLEAFWVVKAKCGEPAALPTLEPLASSEAMPEHAQLPSIDLTALGSVKKSAFDAELQEIKMRGAQPKWWEQYQEVSEQLFLHNPVELTGNGSVATKKAVMLRVALTLLQIQFSCAPDEVTVGELRKWLHEYCVRIDASPLGPAITAAAEKFYGSKS